MLKLRCGVIFLEGFVKHLTERAATEDIKITSIEYLRCLDGERKGGQWWRLGWVPKGALPKHCVFKLEDGVTVAMSPQTQKGLKHRWVDYREGEIVVG